jgi:hypothetical protein
MAYLFEVMKIFKVFKTDSASGLKKCPPQEDHRSKQSLGKK